MRCQQALWRPWQAYFDVLEETWLLGRVAIAPGRGSRLPVAFENARDVVTGESLMIDKSMFVAQSAKKSSDLQEYHRR